jgi:hypothetical protein
MVVAGVVFQIAQYCGLFVNWSSLGGRRLLTAFGSPNITIPGARGAPDTELRNAVTVAIISSLDEVAVDRL